MIRREFDQYGERNMVHLDSTVDLGILERWKQALGDSGIDYSLRNELLGASFPETGIDGRVVELWLHRQEDLATAREILHELETLPSSAQKEWRCPNCSEPIEAQFDVCWKCGAERG